MRHEENGDSEVVDDWKRARVAVGMVSIAGHARPCLFLNLNVTVAIIA